jgi:hypothetical protein
MKAKMNKFSLVSQIIQIIKKRVLQEMRILGLYQTKSTLQKLVLTALDQPIEEG